MRRHYGYSPPGRDSARSRANAALLLTNARSLDALTAETLAHNCRLSLAVATDMLATEQKRRGEA